MRPRTVLVTGAAGLIGSEVVSRLASDGHAVIALTHRRNQIIRNNGRPLATRPITTGVRPGSVSCVSGDVIQPGLGLTAGDHDLLLSLVDLVVHGAAITDFGRPARDYDEFNVNGTAHTLAFATAGDPIPLVYVSTAYVAGEQIGQIAEQSLDAGQRFGTLYEESKFRAETLVWEYAASGLPVAVVRPSTVVGEERSGVIRDFKNIYVVLKMFTEGRVRSVPGYYEATVDIVPVSYVAEVITAAVNRFETARGHAFHATNLRAHTLKDFSDVLAEYPSFEVPRYVPPSSFSAEQLPEPERTYYTRVVGLYESFFRRRTTFDSTGAVELVGRRPRAEGKAYLRKLLDYCVKVGYLGSPLPGVDEVLAKIRTSS